MGLDQLIKLVIEMFPNSKVELYDNFNWTRYTKAKRKLIRVWNDDETLYDFKLNYNLDRGEANDL